VGEKPTSVQKKRALAQKKSSSDNRNGSSKDQKIWYSILANYEMIKGAQLSNSLIILKVLDEVNEPLNAGQISEIIARRTQVKIFKVAGALKESLEHRLRREGFVNGVDIYLQHEDLKAGYNDSILYPAWSTIFHARGYGSILCSKR